MVKNLLLWDTHCHLQDRKLASRVEQVLRDAEKVGIEGIIVPGWDGKSSEDAIILSRRYGMVYAAVGYHPHDARNFSEEKIRSLLNNIKVVAIGEIGLDYYRDLSPRDVQKRVFKRQLALAEKEKLPVIIHTREAFEDTIEIVKHYNTGGVFHAFTGTPEDAKRILDLGFYVGIGGILTFRNSVLKETVKYIPLNRILLETDAPYITPHPHRGKTNEPAFLIYTFNALCEILHINCEEAARVFRKNIWRLFKIEGE